VLRFGAVRFQRAFGAQGGSMGENFLHRRNVAFL
jgi:hypothetical protein